MVISRAYHYHERLQVLSMLPDSWSVELVSPFLISAFRRIVQERSETMVAKALSGAENLMSRANFIDRCEKAGPAIEAAAE